MADGDYFDKIKRYFEELKLINEVANALDNMESLATKLNKTFGQTKERLGEMMNTIADATPGIVRIGGEITNAYETIDAISMSLSKNVVANEKDIVRLYAASKVLSTDVKTIVSNFADVGTSFSLITDQLEDSVNYIRGIGGNTEQIMQGVTGNLDRLNRFQFEGGVVGLTKMAAQSSLLRFNMYETFNLAEKVITPEGAIEVAAAFQRLGVTAGNLVDPFQLMNQSINDPQGLQDSLINVAKQFSYFDEQTKTFKINPQGVLMLREIESQTGVSAKELSKAAVAAQDLDRKLTQINKIGLNFKEDDKKYLANILEMTEEGQYTVNLRSEFGKMVTKPLEEVTKEELQKLLDEQKSGGKTMEEIARNQLTVSNTMFADVRAIKDKVVYGLVGGSVVTDAMAGITRSLGKMTGAASEGAVNYNLSEKVDNAVTTLIGSTSKIYEDLKNGTLKFGDVLAELTKAETGFTDFTKEINQQMKESLLQAFTSQQDITAIESIIKSFGEDFLAKELKMDTLKSSTPTEFRDLLFGKETTTGVSTDTKLTDTISSLTTKITGEVDVKGNVNVNINLPAEFSKFNTTEAEQFFNNLINSESFRKQINNIIKPTNGLIK